MTGRKRAAGAHAEELFCHVVVAVGEQAVLHVEGEAAVVAAHAEQHPLGAVCGHLHLHRDGMGPVQHPRRRIQWHHLGTGVIDVALAVGGDLGSLHREALSAAAVDRQHVVLAGLHIPHADHGDQAVSFAGGEVVGFGEILLEVVELPAVGVELDQLVVADRITEAAA